MISKARIQMIRALQDKKQRQKYGHFVVEGEKSNTELLKSHYEVVNLYATSDWIATHKNSVKSIPVDEVDDKELRQISAHKTPQHVLSVVKIPQEKPATPKSDYVLALDEIQDPGNLGTMIRIADWYGIDTVICSKGCTDLYNPKCISASMGSFLRVHVVYGNIGEVARSVGYPIMVGTLEGENIQKANLPSKGILVIGNEGHGINPEILKIAKFNFSIPRLGGAESLNAAVSAAVMLDNLLNHSA